jgi:hypothetical protein
VFARGFILVALQYFDHGKLELFIATQERSIIAVSEVGFEDLRLQVRIVRVHV